MFSCKDSEYIGWPVGMKGLPRLQDIYLYAEDPDVFCFDIFDGYIKTMKLFTIFMIDMAHCVKGKNTHFVNLRVLRVLIQLTSLKN